MPLLNIIMWKEAYIDIGVSTAVIKQRGKKKWITVGLAVLGIAMLISIPKVGLLGLAGFPLTLIAFIVTIFIDRIAVKRITDTHVWIKGAHPELLRQLPVWTEG